MCGDFVVFFCEWGSGAKDKRFKAKDRPLRENSAPDEKCVRNQTLVDRNIILLPPLHITLSLIK